MAVKCLRNKVLREFEPPSLIVRTKDIEYLELSAIFESLSLTEY